MQPVASLGNSRVEFIAMRFRLVCSFFPEDTLRDGLKGQACMPQGIGRKSAKLDKAKAMSTIAGRLA